MTVQQGDKLAQSVDRRSAWVVSQGPRSLPEPGRTIRSIVSAQLKTSWTRVTPGARFVEDLGADSLDLLQLVLEIEEELGIEIADERGEQFRCLADILEYLAAEDGAGSSGS